MTTSSSERNPGMISPSSFESGVYPSVSRMPEGPHTLVRQLNAVQSRSTLAGMFEAGALILKIRTAADAGNNRPGVVAATSFRQLASLPGMTMSAASLFRAVAIYELCQRMPELLDYKHLGVGHVSAVLCLKDELQVQLLREAQAQRWTKARLQAEVDKYRFRPGHVR